MMYEPKSSRAKVDREECELSKLCKLDQCDLIMQKMLPALKVCNPDPHLT